jgi:hypothetical protein
MEPMPKSPCHETEWALIKGETFRLDDEFKTIFISFSLNFKFSFLFKDNFLSVVRKLCCLLTGRKKIVTTWSCECY